MPTPGKTPPASSDRPLPLVARADLVAKEVHLRGEISWMVKDPVSLDYFRLTAEQYAVLRMLDGTQSVRQLRAAFVREFPSCRPSLQEIQKLAFDLFDKGLAYSTRQGQGEALAERGRERRRGQLKSSLQSMLYIRLPGFDPHLLLRALYPPMRWLFHPAVAMGGALLLLSVWLFLFVRFDEVVHQLPAAASFSSLRSLVLLGLTLGIAKLLHELGHAVACKRFGGECHEIGVAFLVFCPCFYCDVSDAVTLPSRKQRLAIGAAGMYVELLLSAIAAIVWWFTEPGLLRDLALYLFLVTNVSTIAFNLNPLLRFDGYFLLSDWLEIPNLRRQATKVLNRTMARVLAGVTLQEERDRQEKGRWGLLGYAIASSLYRWAFLLVITLSLYALLKPYGLGAAGLLLGGTAAIAGLAGSGRQLWRFAGTHHEELRQSIRPRATGVAVLAAILALFLVPLPLSVEVPLVVQPTGIQHVYVTTPGRLSTMQVEPGQQVAAGQLLAVLQNPSKRDRYEQIRTAVRSQKVDVVVYQATGEAAQQAAATKAFQSLYEEGRDAHQQLIRMRITAPCAGRVIEPAAAKAESSPEGTSQLPKWQGSPLDQASRGAHLPRGTHLLSVAPDGGYQALLLIDQDKRSEFRKGAQVRMQFDSLPGKVIAGRIESVTKWIDEPTLSPGPNDQGAIPSPLTKENRGRYQARVAFDFSSLPLLAGMGGRARVRVTHRTAADWLWRQLRMTFNSHL